MDLIILSSRNVDDENNILYKEWLPLSKIVVILISFVLVVLISAAITTSILDPQNNVLIFSLCGALSLFFVLIGWNYRGMQITLTKYEITVKFGLLNKKTIPIDDLVNFEVTKVTFKKYYGIGIRIGFDSSLAYVTNFGDAVKLTYQESKLFVFSTKNQQKICDLLHELKEKSAKE